jgi:hypothetical protein
VVLLDGMEVLFVAFGGSSTLLSIVVVLIYVASNREQGFLFSCILTSTCCLGS